MGYEIYIVFKGAVVLLPKDSELDGAQRQNRTTDTRTFSRPRDLFFNEIRVC